LFDAFTKQIALSTLQNTDYHMKESINSISGFSAGTTGWAIIFLFSAPVLLPLQLVQTDADRRDCLW